MKICHFCWVNHSHSGGSYHMITNDLSSKRLPLHPGCISQKKDEHGVPKIINKDPENFRIIALHKSVL